jgi:Tfp pilus assembly protein PilF
MSGRWEEARDHSKRALRFDTENSLLQYHAGIIALHFGDRGEAKVRLERALALNPSFHPYYADDARAQIARL